jgi:hypothetical protein
MDWTDAFETGSLSGRDSVYGSQIEMSKKKIGLGYDVGLRIRGSSRLEYGLA